MRKNSSKVPGMEKKGREEEGVSVPGGTPGVTGWGSGKIFFGTDVHVSVASCKIRKADPQRRLYKARNHAKPYYVCSCTGMFTFEPGAGGRLEGWNYGCTNRTMGEETQKG
jgi:hypothetical protein